VLSVSRLCKSFKTGRGRLAVLQDLDLEVARDEIVSIGGHSGAGKTTLLSLIGCLDTPTSGTVFVDGADTARMSRMAQTRLRATTIGFVFQRYHLLEGRSVWDNVYLGTGYSGQPRSFRRTRCSDALETVGLADRRHQYATTLSGGERQRVALARALASDRRLLLCDEPTGNLDDATAGAVLEGVAEFRRQRGAVILVTHDPRAVSIADRHLVLKGGRLAPIGAASGEASPGRTGTDTTSAMAAGTGVRSAALDEPAESVTTPADPKGSAEPRGGCAEDWPVSEPRPEDP